MATDLERIFQTTQGPVGLLAELVVEGTTLVLKDVIVYPIGASKLTGIEKEVRAALTQLKHEAREWGFERLRIIGYRVPGSSSANPGHTIDTTINLMR
jgi:hypothetical protein